MRLGFVLLAAASALIGAGCQARTPDARVEVAHGFEGGFEDGFEGEADPDRMTLDMHTWTWIETLYNNDTVERPNSKQAFTLTFESSESPESGRVHGTTDCNRFNGPYEIDGNKIRFGGEMVSTQMYCDESQEDAFRRALEKVGSFFFTSRGRLILELQYDSGAMQFR